MVFIDKTIHEFPSHNVREKLQKDLISRKLYKEFVLIILFVMNAKSAVFSYLAFRPGRIKDIMGKLPYGKDTIYKAVETLLQQGHLTKGKDGYLRVSSDYHSQKQRELYVKALSKGIDPDVLMRDSTLKVIEAIPVEKTLSEIHQETSLSKKWIAKILSFLEDADLVILRKRKPIIAVVNPDHELTLILSAIIHHDTDIYTLFIPESAPFEEQLLEDQDLERALFEKIDDGLAVKNTGFLVKGDRFRILENVDHELGFEELFLHKIQTQKGVENDCIRLIAQRKVKYKRLLQLAVKKKMVNIVGCYLNIVNDIRPLVSHDIITMFYNESKRSRSSFGSRRPTFLKEESIYGKDGWERRYEETWGVDLYLDLGAIRHGVRAA